MEMKILTSLPLVNVINHRATDHVETIKSYLKCYKIKRALKFLVISYGFN